jgi:hypothetical protein
MFERKRLAQAFKPRYCRRTLFALCQPGTDAELIRARFDSAKAA